MKLFPSSSITSKVGSQFNLVSVCNRNCVSLEAEIAYPSRPLGFTLGFLVMSELLICLVLCALLFSCVFFCFCHVSCLSNVNSVSELSIIDCPFDFLQCLFMLYTSLSREFDYITNFTSSFGIFSMHGLTDDPLPWSSESFISTIRHYFFVNTWISWTSNRKLKIYKWLNNLHSCLDINHTKGSINLKRKYIHYSKG